MNCNCHCNGKCKMLGGLEQKIMEILWISRTPLKPAEVLQRLTDNHAYTTVMTVLKRMSDKGLISRTAKGNTFVYFPFQDKKTFAHDSLEDLFTRLFSSYGQDVTSVFKQTAKKLGFSI